MVKLLMGQSVFLVFSHRKFFMSAWWGDRPACQPLPRGRSVGLVEQLLAGPKPARALPSKGSARP